MVEASEVELDAASRGNTGTQYSILLSRRCRLQRPRSELSIVSPYFPMVAALPIGRLA